MCPPPRSWAGPPFTPTRPAALPDRRACPRRSSRSCKTCSRRPWTIPSTSRSSKSRASPSRSWSARNTRNISPTRTPRPRNTPNGPRTARRSRAGLPPIQQLASEIGGDAVLLPVAVARGVGAAVAPDLLRRRIGGSARLGQPPALVRLGQRPFGLWRQHTRRLGGRLALVFGGWRHVFETWGYSWPWLLAFLNTI